jgi:hypothetical protein
MSSWIFVYQRLLLSHGGTEQIVSYYNLLWGGWENVHGRVEIRGKDFLQKNFTSRCYEKQKSLFLQPLREHDVERAAKVLTVIPKRVNQGL